MYYFRGDDDSPEDEFQSVEGEEDEEIIARHRKFKFLQRILLIVGIITFFAVFIAPQVIKEADFYFTGSRTPDYFDKLEDYSSSVTFGPGVVRYGFTYHVYFNEEILEGAFSEAADEWAGALDGFLSFEEFRDKEDIDLLVEVTGDPTIPGRAYLEYVHKRYRPRIELSIKDMSDPLVLSMIVKHELGHAIGIWGHSDNPRDLMYPSPSRRNLSNRDIRTVRIVYGLEDME